MANLFIKNFPDDLYNKLKEMAEATGRSIKDIVVEALQLRIYGQQAKPDTEMVKYTEPELRQLLFPAKCAKCGKTIPAGEVAWLSKAKYADGSERWLAWHFDCLYVDRKLAQLHVKKRLLERVIRALKKQADELADVISEAEARKKIYDVAHRIEQIAEQIEKELEGLRADIETSNFATDTRKYIQKSFDEINKKVQQLLDELIDAKNKIEEIAAAMSIKPARRRRKKREKEEIGEWWMR